MDNRVLEALFILSHDLNTADQEFGVLTAELEAATARDQLLIIHDSEASPIGLAIWETDKDRPEGCIILTRFFAKPDQRVGAFRLLLRGHFLSLGISSYNRTLAGGGVRKVRWSPPKAKPQERATISEGRIVSFFHGCEVLPGIFADKTTSFAGGAQAMRENLTRKLDPGYAGTYLEFGSKNGTLSRILATRSDANILSIHEDALTLEIASFDAKDLSNIAFKHTKFADLSLPDRSLDGGIISNLARTSKDIEADLCQAMSFMREGAKIVITDHQSQANEATLAGQTIPTAARWEELWRSCGLVVEASEDLTHQAIETQTRLLAALPRDGNGNPEHKRLHDQLASYLSGYQKGELAWKTWTLNKENDAGQTRTRPAKSTREAILVPLSGGIDSVYTLWEALAESDDDVVAHHIHFMNAEARHVPEAISCQSIVQWLEQNCRAFEYSESAIDRTQLRFFGFDMVAVGYEVGLAAQSYRYRHNRPVDYWRVGACLEEGGWPSRWEHVVASCAASSFPFDPPEYSEGKIVTKAEQVRRMPKELTAMTWGCRRPIWKGSTANPCGRCRTCIARGELGLA